MKQTRPERTSDKNNSRHSPMMLSGCPEFKPGIGVAVSSESLSCSWEDNVKLLLTGCLTVSLLGFASLGTANAETVILKADLKGSNEVPPNDSSASGSAEAVFDTQTKQLKYTIRFSGLSGPAVGAHFHGPSDAGKNAGIALPFKTTQSPIEGTATLTDAQSKDLLAGKWYANIHTGAHPGGELRGQMVK